MPASARDNCRIQCALGKPELASNISAGGCLTPTPVVCAQARHSSRGSICQWEAGQGCGVEPRVQHPTKAESGDPLTPVEIS